MIDIDIICSTDPNAPIWDKGKAGPMTQYASHVLREEPRRTFDVRVRIERKELIDRCISSRTNRQKFEF